MRLLCLVWLLAAVAPACSSPTAPSTSLTLRVLDSTTSAPIVGAQVSAPLASAITNTNGDATLTVSENTVVVVSVRAAGYCDFSIPYRFTEPVVKTAIGLTPF